MSVLLVDVSGSRTAPLSRCSEMLRTDAAYGLASRLREVCEKAITFTFSSVLAEVPLRRGFAPRAALDKSELRTATYVGARSKKSERNTTGSS